MLQKPTINSFLDQLRFRIEQKENTFRKRIEGLNSSQAARGLLKSGSTIRQSLDALNEEFSATIDEILEYLGKAGSRSELDRADLFQATAQELLNAAITFKSIVARDRLISFAPSKRIGDVVDEAFAGVDRLLQLKLSEFAQGLHDAALGFPSTSVPASGRYVSLAHNERQSVEQELILLKEEIRGSNEHSEEDRDIALAEIAIFENTIIQQRVPIDLIQRFVDAILRWIKSKFTTASVTLVAERLVVALCHF